MYQPATAIQTPDASQPYPPSSSVGDFASVCVLEHLEGGRPLDSASGSGSDLSTLVKCQPETARQRRQRIEGEIEREHLRRKRVHRVLQVLQLALIGVSLHSLVGYVHKLDANTAACHNPLGEWLVVNFAVTFTLSIFILTSSCLMYFPGGDHRHVACGKKFQLVGHILGAFTMIWSIVAAVWVWGSHGDECDSDLRGTVRTSVILSFTILGLLTLLSPLIYRCVQRARFKVHLRALTLAEAIEEDEQAQRMEQMFREEDGEEDTDAQQPPKQPQPQQDCPQGFSAGHPQGGTIPTNVHAYSSPVHQ